MVEQSLTTAQVSPGADWAVLILDETGRVVSSNATAQRLLGLSAEDISSKYSEMPLTTNGKSDGTADHLATNMGSPLNILNLVDGAGSNIVVKGTRVTLEATLVGRALTLVVLDQNYLPPAGIVSLTNESFAAVSHEIRTSLCSVAGYLDLLMDQYRAIRRADLGKVVRALRRGTHWLEYSIDSLLSAMNIFVGRFGVELRPICVAQLLEDAAAMVEILAAGKKQSLTLVLPEAGAGAVAWADRERMLQVLSTLLAKAIKHEANGGRVTVSATESQGYWQISVSDNSTGQPWWERPYVDVDHDAAPMPTNDPAQTDLSVAIAKYVVDLHGGTVGLTSSPETGHTFWLTLPSAPSGLASDLSEPRTS